MANKDVSISFVSSSSSCSSLSGSNKEKTWIGEWISDLRESKETDSFRSIGQALSTPSALSLDRSSKTIVRMEETCQRMGNDEERDSIEFLSGQSCNKESLLRWIDQNFDSKEEKDSCIFWSPFVVELCLKLCIDHKLFEQFGKIYRSCCDSFPVSNDLKWAYIQILRRQKDHGECIRMLTDWLREFPDNKQAWEIKCKQEVLSESFSDALSSNESWLGCIKKDQVGDSWTCLYYRACIFTKMKDWEQGYKVCKDVHESILKSGSSEKEFWKAEIDLLSSQKTSGSSIKSSGFSWSDFCSLYYMCMFETKRYVEYIKKIKEIPKKMMDQHPQFSHLGLYECLANQALQRYGEALSLWKANMTSWQQSSEFVVQFSCWNYFCLEDYAYLSKSIHSIRSRIFVHPLDSFFLIAESIQQTFDRFHHESVQRSIKGSMDWIPQPIRFHKEGLLDQYGDWAAQFWFFEDSSINRMSYWKGWILQAWACYFLFSGYPWIAWFLFSRCTTLNKNCFRACLMSFIDLGVSGKLLLPAIQKDDRIKFSNAKHPLDRFLWTRYLSTVDSRSEEQSPKETDIVDRIQENASKKNRWEGIDIGSHRPLIERWLQENPDYPIEKLDPFKFLLRIDVAREDWKPWLPFEQWDREIEYLNFQPSQKMEWASVWKKHIYVPHFRPCSKSHGSSLPFVIDRCIALRCNSWSNAFFETYRKKKDERMKSIMKNPKTFGLLLESLRSILSKEDKPFVPPSLVKEDRSQTPEKEIRDWKSFFSCFSDSRDSQGRWNPEDVSEIKKHYKYIFGESKSSASDVDETMNLEQFWKDIECRETTHKKKKGDKNASPMDLDEMDREIRFLQETLQGDWKTACSEFVQTPKFFSDHPVRPFWLVIEEDWIDSEVSSLASDEWKDRIEKGIEGWMRSVKEKPWMYFSLKQWFLDHPVHRCKKLVLLYCATILDDEFTLKSLISPKKVRYQDQNALLLMVFYCNR